MCWMVFIFECSSFAIAMKKSVVIGASPNPARYAHMAVNRLVDAGHPVVPIGIRNGEIAGLEIVTDRPEIADVDTVTLYVGPVRQPQWYDYIFSLKPKRIILNPGTENMELERMAHEHGVEPVEACTLVMLSVGNY